MLQGARSEAHAKTLEKELRKFDVVSLVDMDLAIAGAKNYRTLREQGITIRKTIDLVIGTYCIARRCRLLHSDRDFDPMQAHLGLKVVEAAWAVPERRAVKT